MGNVSVGAGRRAISRAEPAENNNLSVILPPKTPIESRLAVTVPTHIFEPRQQMSPRSLLHDGTHISRRTLEQPRQLAKTVATSMQLTHLKNVGSRQFAFTVRLAPWPRCPRASDLARPEHSRGPGSTRSAI